MTRLVLLGLLLHKNMHGYEIQNLIEQNKINQWANLLSGSIYYALSKMEKESFIETIAEESTGARIRKIYGITEKGRNEFNKLLKNTLKKSPHTLQSDFSLILNWIREIPTHEAINMLKDTIDEMNQKKMEWERNRRYKRQQISNPFLDAGFENAIEILEVDIRYLNRIIQLLKTV